jgi:phosphomevalonate kinase
MIATAPGKLILSGEYAVLDGAPALVIAVDRRAAARRVASPPGGSPFLDAVAAELAARRGPDDPAARAARELAVDSSAFYDGDAKLGLGSSAAVTAAAAARALAEAGPLDLAEVLAVAQAAHAAAQGPRGARGSGADVAAAVHGGVIVYELAAGGPRIKRRAWPADLVLVPFFTGRSADTPQLVAQVAAARAPGAASAAAVDAALAEIAAASREICAALAEPPPQAAASAVPAVPAVPAVSAASAIAAFRRAGLAIDALARAAGAELVPACVTAAREAIAPLGGAVKTTGAGGGDLGVALLPAGADRADRTFVSRALIQAGCRPLILSPDETGVDLRPDAG